LLRSALEPQFFLSNGTLLLQAVSAQQQNQQLLMISPPAVGNWLLLSSILILMVIVIRGVMCLTEPRLSITEWQPIMGIFLPLSRIEWEDKFDEYKATSEFCLYVFFFEVTFS
jgi:cytochrome c oxidase assembly protein subunit 15